MPILFSIYFCSQVVILALASQVVILALPTLVGGVVSPPLEGRAAQLYAYTTWDKQECKSWAIEFVGFTFIPLNHNLTTVALKTGGIRIRTTWKLRSLDSSVKRQHWNSRPHDTDPRFVWMPEATLIPMIISNLNEMLNKYKGCLIVYFCSIFQVPCGLDFGSGRLAIGNCNGDRSMGMGEGTQRKQGKRSGESSLQSPDKDGEVCDRLPTPTKSSWSLIPHVWAVFRLAFLLVYI